MSSPNGSTTITSGDRTARLRGSHRQGTSESNFGHLRWTEEGPRLVFLVRAPSRSGLRGMRRNRRAEPTLRNARLRHSGRAEGGAQLRRRRAELASRRRRSTSRTMVPLRAPRSPPTRGPLPRRRRCRPRRSRARRGRDHRRRHPPSGAGVLLPRRPHAAHGANDALAAVGAIGRALKRTGPGMAATQEAMAAAARA
jgi:hypothetical protein